MMERRIKRPTVRRMKTQISMKKRRNAKIAMEVLRGKTLVTQAANR